MEAAPQATQVPAQRREDGQLMLSALLVEAKDKIIADLKRRLGRV
jgi:hypothetical protein